ncbi:MAG: PilT/PilU family type 4a pilus ATPase [Gammaproteobacteria bacterium]|nr:PilT/PilU family type 4a pilus ATPase [Gammaproteobacteria bacterium]
MDFEALLKLMVSKQASDLFITAGAAPSIKINGKVVPVTQRVLSPEKAREVSLSVMNEDQRKTFSRTHECNFAISAHGIGRFRVSTFQQRNHIGMVLRRIKTQIPTTDELKLPPILNDIAMTKRGLVIMVGATGTGKSTSLAAMIGYRNRNTTGHIISIEDPIEFIHNHDKCIVTQREVGIDTDSFEVALKNMLRQAPDVILIGEVRTPETMEYAIAFAETGHLCMCTLHANNANQALDRILHFFSEDRRNQILMDLSMNLKAIVAQQLIPTPDGKGRQAAIEVMINTPLMSDHIRKGEIHLLKELISKSNELGLQTFDQSLFKLFKAGDISYEDALKHADSPNDLRLMIKLDQAEDNGLKLDANDMNLEEHHNMQ